jgi:uncharacterized protein (TIRG00374 family)
MRASIKKGLSYFFSLLVAGLLLWYVFRNIELDYMLAKLKDVRFEFIIISILLAVLSNVFRAYRWNLLFRPLGYHGLTTFRTFLAVMVGYLANLAVPRMGEVSKCGALAKTDKVPLTLSIGTVVAERIVDLLCLVVIFGATLIIEFNRLRDIFISIFQEKLSGFEQYAAFGIALVILVPTAIFLFYLFLRSGLSAKFRRLTLYVKVRTFLLELINGLSSIKDLKRKEQRAFWVSTVLIWVCYYYMAFIVFYALDETIGLGFGAGLAVLSMGSIGMAAPVQGGIGAFHLLVASTLALYGIDETDGKLFATILHTSQMLFYLIAGAVAIILVALIKRKDTKENHDRI